MYKIIIDEYSIYQIDEECMKRKQMNLECEKDMEYEKGKIKQKRTEKDGIEGNLYRLFCRLEEPVVAGTARRT